MKKLRNEDTRRRKLELRAETVVALAAHELEQVVGGRTGLSDCHICRDPN